MRPFGQRAVCLARDNPKERRRMPWTHRGLRHSTSRWGPTASPQPKLLVAAKADPDLETPRGAPSEYALLAGSPQMVQILLSGDLGKLTRCSYALFGTVTPFFSERLSRLGPVPRRPMPPATPHSQSRSLEATRRPCANPEEGGNQSRTRRIVRGTRSHRHSRP